MGEVVYCPKCEEFWDEDDLEVPNWCWSHGGDGEWYLDFDVFCEYACCPNCNTRRADMLETMYCDVCGMRAVYAADELCPRCREVIDTSVAVIMNRLRFRHKIAKGMASMKDDNLRRIIIERLEDLNRKEEREEEEKA